ncbi:hypothetical protein FPG87_12455 [Flavobacterium psychrophilum]|uniref:Uncharacterized protein n=1 Tax=Flavobacterium psychrophilum TaxID=96345 RepID=A0A7U2NHP0_FLAPS|nr:hypothetical protein [Flavobacterium psychrophilum]MBF2091270.1 hypothetical protein [Flavobacterium psychrophilum]OAE92149.1 hypothetical protein SU65_10365 [Flavobacterium psychrophilum]OJH10053.1 hypothetical protein FPG87_12455 [Flavobacterium psychrophilum]QRE05304.1 hypothetical protein H0H26_06880 [Flavobacterium psychrophilum]SNA67054.1 conserved hypothetical protein [Flavobacterium psychrophilum]
MKQVLQNIQNKLSEVPELKYIDEDWGQLNMYQPPVKWPCCLIDIANVNYSNLGVDRAQQPQNRQLGKISVKITLATLKLTNTSMQAPQVQKDQAWFIWDLAQTIHEKLHGFCPEINCSKMLRRSLERTQRDDGVQEYQIMYEFEANNI